MSFRVMIQEQLLDFNCIVAYNRAFIKICDYFLSLIQHYIFLERNRSTNEIIVNLIHITENISLLEILLFQLIYSKSLVIYFIQFTLSTLSCLHCVYELTQLHFQPLLTKQTFKNVQSVMICIKMLQSFQVSEQFHLFQDF